MMKVVKSEIKWQLAEFEKLSGKEIHDMLHLRESVFVVEQACAYQEIDGLDPLCRHITGTDEKGVVIATARVAPEGVIYGDTSIGRVAVRPDHRNKGYARIMMNLGIDRCKRWPDAKGIKIAAQKYLEPFYRSFGFKTVSEPYLWDGIDHVDMRLSF